MWPFSKQDGRKDNGRDFSEIDRDKSHIARLENEIRKQRVKYLKEKLERLKAAQEEEHLEEQIAELEGEFERDDEEDERPDASEMVGMMNNPDAMMMNVLLTALTAKRQAPVQAPVTQPTAKATLSDDKLHELKTKIPGPILKKIKKMNDAELMDFGRQYVPDYFEQFDDDTIKRAMVILRA